MAGPGTTTVSDLMRAAVAAAVLAPSSHNSQPWRFRRVGTRLELRTDPARHLQVIDAEQRQLVMSCGCALHNARLAIRAAGYREHVEITAGGGPPGLLAIIAVGRPEVSTLADRELALAIPRRHTNRRAFLTRPIAATVTTPLIERALAEGVAMVRLLPGHKRAIGQIVDQADRTQYDDPAFRAELARWLAPLGSLRRDGIPFVEKEYGSRLPFSVMRALRSPGLGGAFGRLEAERATSAPVVLAMGTPADTPRDWMCCGEVLQATLLRATTLGLSASFLNQALEIPALRVRVAKAVPELGYPQMIFRLGVPAEDVRHPAPRRSVDDVLDTAW